MIGGVSLTDLWIGQYALYVVRQWAEGTEAHGPMDDAITNARVGLSLHNTSDPRALIPRRPNRHERRAAAARNR
jgi:hypothetical protein